MPSAPRYVSFDALARLQERQSLTHGAEFALARLELNILATGIPLGGDDDRWARICKLTLRKWLEAKQELLAAGLIFIDQYGLAIPWCTEALWRSIERIEKARSAGTASANKRNHLTIQESGGASVEQQSRSCSTPAKLSEVKRSEGESKLHRRPRPDLHTTVSWWRHQLQDWNREGWPPNFPGNPPGHPGCKVPRSVLREFGLPSTPR